MQTTEIKCYFIITNYVNDAAVRKYMYNKQRII
jgi:hypothetical protein